MYTKLNLMKLVHEYNNKISKGDYEITVKQHDKNFSALMYICEDNSLSHVQGGNIKELCIYMLDRISSK